MATVIPKVIPKTFNKTMLNRAEALMHGASGVPRSGLIWYAPLSNGMIDTIGLSAKTRTPPAPYVYSAPTLPTPNRTLYVNGSGAEYSGAQGTYGIGNDTTGNGSLATPYATLSKAESTLTAGVNIVYVAAGSYSGGLLWTTANRSATWVADGVVTVTGNGTRTFLFSTVNQSFVGFTFPGSAGDIFWLASSRTLTLTDCIFDMSSTGKILYDSGGSYSNRTITFNNCTFNVSNANTTVTIGITIDSPTTVNILGGTINLTSAKSFLTMKETTTALTHNATIKGCSINILGNRPNDNNADVFVFGAAGGGNKTIVFSDNVVTFGDVSNPNDLAAFIDIKGRSSNTDNISFTAQNNNFSAIQGNGPAIRFIEAFNVDNPIVITDNEFRYKNDAVVAVLFNTCGGLCSFTDNEVYGPVWYGNQTPSVTHPVNFKGSYNALFARNKIYGTAYGVVIKATTADQSLASGGVFFNYFEDCTGPVIHPKGVAGTPIYNNTIVNTGTRSVTTYGGIYLGDNDPEYGSSPTPNCIVKNNIIDFRDANSSRAFWADSTGSLPLTSDYNAINCPGICAAIGVTNYADLDAWKVAGYDEHSVETVANTTGINPFVSGSGDQYDVAGYMVRSHTFDAPVYHGRPWFIGAYSYGGGGKHYDSMTIVSGSSMEDYVLKFPPCPGIADIDDGTIYTGGTINELDMATFTDLPWLRAGSRGIAAWSDDLTAADQAKADKYLR